MKTPRKAAVDFLAEQLGPVDDFLNDDREHIIEQGLPAHDWEQMVNYVKLARVIVVFPGDIGYENAIVL